MAGREEGSAAEMESSVVYVKVCRETGERRKLLTASRIGRRSEGSSYVVLCVCVRRIFGRGVVCV